MATTAKWYGNGLKAVASGSINWTSDTIKAAAVASAYTPNQNTHAFFSDVTNELATANGYTAGGATLGTKSIDLTALAVTLRAAATVWTPSAGQTLTINKIVVYKSTGTASTSPLLGWVDLGGDVSAVGAAFTVTWDATDGVLKLLAA